MALVTGATGFTGQYLVRQLAQCGVRIRATAREHSSRQGLADIPVDWRTGNLHDARFVREAVQGVDYIFHLASNYRRPGQSEKAHRDVHVVSTQLLAREASSQPGFKRFVHVSTIGVHGHIDNPPADETYRFAPGDSYQRTKLEAEQWLAAFARDSGLPAVVVRPAAIYGPGDRRLLKLFRMATWPVVPLVGYGRGLYHLIHVEDLAEMLMHAAVHPAAPGEAFICAAGEPLPIASIIRQAASAYGLQNRFVRVPAWPLEIAARVCNDVCRVLQVEPPLHPRRIAFFTKDRAFNASKMQRVLGFTPRVNHEEGIARTARWYAEQGWVQLPGIKGVTIRATAG
jgi:dihydroflavonol-4-reductase